jgi:hypothetical protein
MQMNIPIVSTVSIVLLVMLNLLAWLQILKLRRSWRNPVAADNSYLGLAMSAFSNGDHPDLLRDHDEVNPLTEAEIYVIYGRRDDARKVLESALRAGRISGADVTAFWAEQNAR